LAQEISRGLSWRIGKVESPEAGGIIPGAQTLAEHEEAKALLERLGPLRTIELARFTKWIEPFFYASASRMIPPEERQKVGAALFDFVRDMPAEVFTDEARRRLAEITEWMPTAKHIKEMLGPEARRIRATYKVLEELAKPLPPALPAPEPKTPEQIEQERQERIAHVEKVMAEYRAAQVERTAEAMAAFPAVAMSGPAAATWRADNPIVQAAIAARAREMRKGAGEES
jgi:hypothetical protein